MKWFSLSEENKRSNDFQVIASKENLNLKELNKFNPDLIFFPHWNWIVPKEILDKFNCIVFHTAPLPFGRGGSPIQNLILKGFLESPICALKMTEELDAGPIYLKKTLSLDGPLKEILKRMNTLVNEMIFELTKKLPEPKDQVGKKTLFKRLTHEDNKIPKNISIKDAYDRIRMLDDVSYPNSFIEHGNLRIEFYEAEFADQEIHCKVTVKPSKEMV